MVAATYSSRSTAGASRSEANHVRPMAAFGTVTNLPPGQVVISVPTDQLYLWSSAWQEQEREALAELEAGNGRQFSSAIDAAKWLLSDDD